MSKERGAATPTNTFNFIFITTSRIDTHAHAHGVVGLEEEKVCLWEGVGLWFRAARMDVVKSALSSLRRLAAIVYFLFYMCLLVVWWGNNANQQCKALTEQKKTTNIKLEGVRGGGDTRGVCLLRGCGCFVFE